MYRRSPMLSGVGTAPDGSPVEVYERLPSWWRSARSITSRPVTQMSAIWAACDPTASTTEIATPRLYGPRNDRSRANVRRYGTALTVLNVPTQSYALGRGNGA